MAVSPTTAREHRTPHFTFTSVADWPVLAWLGRCEAATGEVSVRHGSRVEATRTWFCEAAWDGDFEAGDFDTTDIVAGTGARLRDDAVTFVSAGSANDRLHSFEGRNGVAWVSNSLPCLLAAVGGELDPTDSSYRRLICSILRGHAGYERWLPSSVGPIRLTYFDNLRWEDGTLTVVAKPFGDRAFPDFASYRAFLQRSIIAMIDNARSPKRTHPVRPLGTLSSGYDSATVSVLGREAGLHEVISFAKVYGGPNLGAPDVDDSGAAIAQALGLRCHVIEAREPAPLEEVPIFAANGYGEDMHYLAATPHLAGRLLFTGNRGDYTWGKDAGDLTKRILGGGFTGLSISEFRLWAGFIHAPVAYWGGRALAQINSISNSAAMKPWDVPGPYSRPICRRIIEEAGLPRGTFATRKRGGATMPLIRRSFLSAASAAHYQRWLRAQRGRWLRAGRIPPPTSLRLDRLTLSSVRRFETLLSRTSWWIATRCGWSALPHHPVIRRLCTITQSQHPEQPWIPVLRRYLFQWGVSVATKRYAAAATPVHDIRA